MFILAQDSPGLNVLLMGNEAFCRGALEGGVQVCAAYPGTPSSEIIGELSGAAKEKAIYVEWSTNEKVALEVATAASFTGLRGLAAMKNEGLNVALDTLAHLNLSGIGDNCGGLVVVVCDDPGALSSASENDGRWVARLLDLPLLEPSSVHEVKEMTKWAFELSEELKVPCLVRSCTRISHTSGNVTLGELPQPKKKKPYFDTSQDVCPLPAPAKHLRLHQKLAKARELFESSSFNWYTGPGEPELLIVCSGSGWLHSVGAVEELKLTGLVGLLKVGTTWPLPEKFILKNLARAKQVLVIEEVDPFLEGNLKQIAYDSPEEAGTPRIYGKRTGHVKLVSELTSNVVIEAICHILDLEYKPIDPNYESMIEEVKGMVSPRGLTFCPGCPHRASFWTIKNVLRMDGRDGFISGDIGCYTMERRPTSYQLTKTMHSMGAGVGFATGFGKLSQFGFNQPVIATCGDSTFYHAAIPALINAVYNQSDLMMVVLDNSATAMTGFQPHPGTGYSAVGDPAPIVDIEKICIALSAKVEVTDPFDLKGSEDKASRLLDEHGVRVLIFRRECELIRMREETKKPYKVWVDVDKCIGEACGCNRYCTRIFKCPPLVWDKEAGKAQIDETSCSGCGVCANICPEGAIIKEARLYGCFSGSS